jgi:hypothetical protein
MRNTDSGILDSFGGAKIGQVLILGLKLLRPSEYRLNEHEHFRPDELWFIKWIFYNIIDMVDKNL